MLCIFQGVCTMVRSCFKSVAFAAVLVILSAVQCAAVFQLASPTDGLAVRENVKIQVPESVVPDSGFISLLLSDAGKLRFVVAISRDSAKLDKGVLTFYWNSKAPYYDSTDPMKPKFFKDGRYPFVIQVHEASGRAVDRAQVNIELKNRVPRTNPAPGIRLANSLTFGQYNEYRIHSEISVFDLVNGMGLPLLGGLGMSADSKIIQTVEDARPGNQYLLRYRVDDKTFVAANGYKKLLYAAEAVKPQLYRLVDSHGQVIKANMFAKQARFQIMDILPTLPKEAVKEGDSWADRMTIKIDGMTGLMKLSGSAMLDSFEWHSGRECAKITSVLSGQAPLVLVNGKVRGSGTVAAEVTTYFAYKTGKMLERRIRLTSDAVIMPGAGDAMASDQAADTMMSSPIGDGVSPYSDDVPGEAPIIAPNRPNRGFTPPGLEGAPMGPTVLPGDVSTPDNTNKKGKIEFNIVVRLEK